MRTFSPRLDILPPEQRRLWPDLAPTVDLDFVLYGGTAIALRLGHRPSVDFDFFSEASLDRAAIRAALPFVDRSMVVQDEPDAWTMLVPVEGGDRDQVKVSFFGGITFGRVGEPDRTADGVMVAASLQDLLATKVKVVLQRAESKDYRDIARMLEAGASLADGLASAVAMYGPGFQPSESLRALVFFRDGDLASLADSEKITLVHAVKAVRLLPEARILSRHLGAPSRQR
jgi:Nucleotidyl transferase AbiEii toxin, Type IV TA system